MNRILVVVGAILSVAYLAAVVAIRWPIGLNELRAMSLNNFGDALAGIVGPLALLWLILGFLQQGEELKQNTAALQLQAEELKAAVEQQKENVRISSEALEWNRSVRLREDLERSRIRWPRFVPSMSLRETDGESTCQYSTSFELEIAPARIAHVTSPDFEVTIIYAPPLMDPGNFVAIEFGNRAKPKELPALLKFNLQFADEEGAEFRQEVSYHIRPNGTYSPDYKPPVSWAEVEASGKWS